MENVVVDHLLRLTIAHNTHNPPINDEFPEESLLLVENITWYAHIANYLAIGELPADWKAQDRKFFFSKIHSYYWEEPFLYNKGYSATAMRMHVEAILLPRKLLRRYYSPDFIGLPFSRMLIPCVENATNAKDWRKYLVVK